MKVNRIATIAGDGIGPEVIAAGKRVLVAAAEAEGGFALDFTDLPWGTAYYTEHGRMMPEDAIATLASYDAICLGAVGWPTVPDHVTLWGLLIPIRREFDQYINLRPVRLLRGVQSPLAQPGEIDIVVVHENTEGEYSDVGGRIYTGTPHELAIQESIFTRRGVERVVRYAYALAAKRGAKLVGATKSNGIRVTMKPRRRMGVLPHSRWFRIGRQLRQGLARYLAAMAYIHDTGDRPRVQNSGRLARYRASARRWKTPDG